MFRSIFKSIKSVLTGKKPVFTGKKPVESESKKFDTEKVSSKKLRNDQRKAKLRSLRVHYASIVGNVATLPGSGTKYRIMSNGCWIRI